MRMNKLVAILWMVLTLMHVAPKSDGQIQPMATDLSVTSLNEPVSPFAFGVQNVRVSIQNSGPTTSNSATLYWEVNGIPQPVKMISGPTLSGAVATNILLGTFYFEPDSSYDLKIWTSNPNGTADPNPANDTLYVNGLAPEPTLKGIYTVGGTSADFPTVGDALNHVTFVGVSAPVAFNIRPGTYGGTLIVHPIPGASALNTVTFQSEYGDSTGVVITSTLGSIQFVNNPAHIRFHQLTLLGSLNDSNVKGGGDDIRITNCALLHPVNTAPYHNLVGTYTNSVFQQNKVINASMGIRLAASTNTEIIDNFFSGQGNEIIQVSNAEDIRIAGNVVNGASSSFSSAMIVQAIDVISSNGVEISSNVLSPIAKRHCIKVERCDSVSIFNNMILGQQEGIVIDSGTMVSIYHNTIRTNGLPAPNGADKLANILLSGSQGVTILNNILVNAYSTYGISVLDVLTNFTSDYNNFYSSAGNSQLVIDGATLDLATWQNNLSLDNQSLSIDPLFVSETDLHAQHGALSGAGSPIPGLSVDIDGEPRSNSSPAIGADEFTPYLNDGGIAELLSPVFPTVAGPQNFIVTVTNAGSNDLDSAILHWEVDGMTQPPVKFMGKVAPGELSPPFTLGTYTFPGPPAQSDVRIWISEPNGAPDSLPVNDTIRFDDVKVGMDGVYTIGGINPDFASFANAIGALINFGVGGPVTFLMRPGIYDATATFGQINGVSLKNTVTFSSQSNDSTSVVLANIGNLNSFYLDFFRFQSLTLTGTQLVLNSSFPKSKIEQVMIRNCEVYCNIIFESGGAENCLISNNKLYQSLVQTFIPGFGVLNASSSLIIRNNRFIGSILPENIDLQSVKNGIIQDNVFTDGVVNVFNCDFCNISRNRLLNGSIQYLHSSTEPNSRTVLVNNVVSRNVSNDPVGGIYSYGIKVETRGAAVGTIDVLHNTINVNFLSPPINPPGAFEFSDFSFGGISTANINVLNNILVTDSVAPAYRFDTIHSNFIQSDYNCIYSKFGSLVNGYASLPTWQAASGFDLNSVVLDPRLSATDAFRPANPALDGTGLPLNLVLGDIDGDARSLTAPDVGADEFAVCSGDLSTIFTSNLGISTVTLNWAGQNSTDGYLITGGLVNTPFTAAINLPSPSSTSFNLITLKPNTSYYWSIEASCDTNINQVQRPVTVDTFTTLPCLPVDSIYHNNLTATSVRLNWQPVAGAQGYALVGKQLGGPLVRISLGATITSFDVTGLTPGATYIWTVLTGCDLINKVFSPLAVVDTFTTAVPKNDLVVLKPADAATISVVPNPSSGSFEIRSEQIMDRARVEIFDRMGIKLLELQWSESKTKRLQLKERGLYLIRITTDNDMVEIKAVVQ